MKPILQALLLADRVYEDKLTGKKIIAGIFHKMFYIPKEHLKDEAEKLGGIPFMPAGFQAGSPFAYISMTEIRGEQPFSVRYVDLSNDNVLLQLEFKASVQDPLEIVDFILPLPPLPANKPGVFALELLWRDEPLGSCRLKVEEQRIGGPSNGN